MVGQDNNGAYVSRIAKNNQVSMAKGRVVWVQARSVISLLFLSTRKSGELHFHKVVQIFFTDYLNVFRCLISFPHDVSDIYLSGEDFIAARTLGACLEVEFFRGAS